MSWSPSGSVDSDTKQLAQYSNLLTFDQAFLIIESLNKMILLLINETPQSRCYTKHRFTDSASSGFQVYFMKNICWHSSMKVFAYFAQNIIFSLCISILVLCNIILLFTIHPTSKRNVNYIVIITFFSISHNAYDVHDKEYQKSIVQ